MIRPGYRDAVCVWEVRRASSIERSTGWYIICAIALEQFVSATICLLPLTLVDANGVRLANDGAQILAALRGKPPPTQRQLTPAERPSGLRRYRSAFWLLGTVGGLIVLGLVLQATRSR